MIPTTSQSHDPSVIGGVKEWLHVIDKADIGFGAYNYELDSCNGQLGQPTSDDQLAWAAYV